MFLFESLFFQVLDAILDAKQASNFISILEGLLTQNICWFHQSIVQPVS